MSASSVDLFSLLTCSCLLYRLLSSALVYWSKWQIWKSKQCKNHKTTQPKTLTGTIILASKLGSRFYVTGRIDGSSTVYIVDGKKATTMDLPADGVASRWSCQPMEASLATAAVAGEVISYKVLLNRHIFQQREIEVGRNSLARQHSPLRYPLQKCILHGPNEAKSTWELVLTGRLLEVLFAVSFVECHRRFINSPIQQREHQKNGHVCTSTDSSCLPSAQLVTAP